MISLYRVSTGDEDLYEYGGMLSIIPKMDWFSSNVMTLQAYEYTSYTLIALDKEENEVTSEHLQDIDEVGPAIFAFSENAWIFLPELLKSGCRVAEQVKVNGALSFKLVYPGTIVDLLDHETSDLIINEAAGAISHVRNPTLFETDDDLPLMFQVKYRGLKISGPSMDVFVTQEFVDNYEQLGLTGATFKPVARSKVRNV